MNRVSVHKREDLRSISLATQVLCFSVVTTLVALRLFAKVKLRHPFGVDDASCYLAWALLIGHSISALFYTNSGGVISSNSSGSWNYETKYKIFYIATMFYVPMVLFVKTSLIYTMIRLWSPYRAKVLALYAFLIFLICYYTIILFVKVFTCNPIRLYWLVNQRDRTCMNVSAVIIADSVISVVTDLAILAFPVALSWSLHVRLSKKLHVIAILGAGGIAIAFSIYRLVLVTNAQDTSDQLELLMRVLLSDNAEGGLGLICTCIPAINKLCGEMSRKWKWKTREEQCRAQLFTTNPGPARNDAQMGEHVLLESLPTTP